ncbi:MAG: septal ring lytic transglycosylase RlpA family protein [Treponema sp.]|jgi:rare lipoprotein A (peptidoglycan hydrolase)|nr:septal ring lytic transglycosylase RlpA family protein [Treponema sp.]
MKKITFFLTLGVVLSATGFSQESRVLRMEGMGYWYDQGSGFYASHATLPFGTELIVTNLDNGKQVTVRVGGRIPQDPRWIVDVSPQAADTLEMNDMGFTRVRIEEVVKAATVKALRASSVRLFQQNGRAVVLASGTELTAGHPSLSIGRQIRITNRANGQVVVATIRSRVRASQDRIIEVSPAVARALGVPQGSYVNVSIESIDR